MAGIIFIHGTKCERSQSTTFSKRRELNMDFTAMQGLAPPHAIITPDSTVIPAVPLRTLRPPKYFTGPTYEGRKHNSHPSLSGYRTRLYSVHFSTICTALHVTAYLTSPSVPRMIPSSRPLRGYAMSVQLKD